MYTVGDYVDLRFLNERPSQSFGELASANVETDKHWKVKPGTRVVFVNLSAA